VNAREKLRVALEKILDDLIAYDDAALAAVVRERLESGDAPVPYKDIRRAIPPISPTPEPEVCMSDCPNCDRLRAALEQLVVRMERMLLDDYCDCPPEGHMCGRLDVKIDIMRARAALAATRGDNAV